LFPEVEEITLKQEGPCAPWSYLQRVDLTCPFTKLKVVRICGVDRPSNLEIQSQDLKVLEISGATDLGNFVIPDQSFLEEVTFDTVPRIHPKILEKFLASASTMKKFTITSSPSFEVLHVEHFLREGINLQFVNISSLRYVNDTTLKLLHSHKYLERLQIDDCPGITGQGIIRLVQNLCKKGGGRLTWISVKGNESIRRQTIDWARSCEVIVSI
jgi:hypothetical protein